MYKNINIPTKLVVGFQNRNDTYSGKLGFIVYYKNDKNDKKDKTSLSSQASWEGWIDRSIPVMEIDNDPIEGFVINKDVQRLGYYYSSGAKYVRVYDPRGFEIEITIENLLYIMSYCYCHPGKGLEGEFVYGWRGQRLILIPTKSEVYQTNSKIEKLKTDKISGRDVEPGYVYSIKHGGDLHNVIYLGRFRNFLYGTYRHFIYFCENSQIDTISSKKDFLAKVGDEQCPEYLDIYRKFRKNHLLNIVSYDFSPLDKKQLPSDYFALVKDSDLSCFWSVSKFSENICWGSPFFINKVKNNIYVTSSHKLFETCYSRYLQDHELKSLCPVSIHVFDDEGNKHKLNLKKLRY